MFFTKIADIDRSSCRVHWSTGWVCTWSMVGNGDNGHAFTLHLCVFVVCECESLDLTWSGLIRNQSCVIILIADNTHCSSGDDCPRTTARRDNSTTFWTQERLCKYYIGAFFFAPFQISPPCFLALFSSLDLIISGKNLTNSS